MIEDNFELRRETLDKGTKASIELGKAFARIGVGCLYLGDSWASGSIISRRMYSHDTAAPRALLPKTLANANP